MKKIFLGALILGLVPCVAQAQSSAYSKGHGYGYFGLGGRAEGGGHVALHLGGGVEFFFKRHVGVGAEYGYLGNGFGFREFDSFGVLSPNLVARVRAKDDKTRVEPFVTAG